MKLSFLINARVPSAIILLSNVEYLVVKRFRRRLYNFVICFSQVGVPLMSYMFYSQKNQTEYTFENDRKNHQKV